MEEIKSIVELDEVLSKNENLHIVKFYGQWCAPCKMLQNTIEKIAPTLEGVDFYGVDVDEADETLIDKYMIRSVPILLYFKGSLQVDRTMGALPEKMLLEKIEENNRK